MRGAPRAVFVSFEAEEIVMKKVYIITTHTVPTEHPNAVRLANLGLIFKELGYEVSLVGFDHKPDRTEEYKGMRCLVYNIPNAQGISANLKRGRYVKSMVAALLESEETPEIIVSSMYNCPLQRYLISHAKKNNIKLIQTVCEWFDKSAFPGLKGKVKLINNRYSLYCQFPRVGNIIAISTLQAGYYAERGCNTVVIPTLVDSEEYDGVTAYYTPNTKLAIAYAGSPAKKDYLANVIRAIGLLSEEERAGIELHLYGCTTEGLIGLGIDEKFLKDNERTIICHGRIPYCEVKEKIAKADFTVLLRPNMRYANAGFPTKVGESMACGTPVIANLTSDLGKYLVDGSNAIICENETPEACATALRKALNVPKEELMLMRSNARSTALSSFNWMSYTAELKKFLEL